MNDNVCLSEEGLHGRLRLQVLSDVIRELHGCSAVHLLLTSRIRMNNASIRPLLLTPMDAVNAVKLLRDQQPSWQPAQAARVAELCQHNALLLTIIAGLVANERCTAQVSSTCVVHHAILVYHQHHELTTSSMDNWLC